MTAPDAAYFDDWYADMSASAARDALVEATLGLPPGLESSSLLTWDGIGEVAEALALPPGSLLLDLACGRGGYGRELALRCGARLLGVDFSAVAVARARERADGLDATYQVGDLTATGLDDHCVDAVVCVDAVQFADPPLAALQECRRVLRPGGRVVLTSWEAADPEDEELPPRARRVHLEADLRAAGFQDVTVRHRPAWEQAEWAMWESAVAADVAGDPALASLQEEGRRVLAVRGRTRRVLAVGVAPAG